MKVKLSVLIGVEWCDAELGPPSGDDPLRGRLLASVEEAVRNSLLRSYGDGFTHDMENLVALKVDDVEAVELV